MMLSSSLVAVYDLTTTEGTAGIAFSFSDDYSSALAAHSTARLTSLCNRLRIRAAKFLDFGGIFTAK